MAADGSLHPRIRVAAYCATLPAVDARAPASGRIDPITGARPAASPRSLARLIAGRLEPGAELVIPIAAGEPAQLVAALEAESTHLRGVRIHQMHALHDHPYLHGARRGRLEHTSWFLSDVTRPAYSAGACDLCPSNFSEMPQRLLERRPALVMALASAPDPDGWFSLGVSADYVAPLIGRVPFAIEVTRHMPRTAGRNRIHLRDVIGWTQSDAVLPPVRRPPPSAADRAIGSHVAERVPDGATIQVGSGSSPRAVAQSLSEHRDLGIHTELLSDELMLLIESGVATGRLKARDPGLAVATFALGSERLYAWLDGNDAVLFRGVDETNDPRRVAQEQHFVAVNGAIQVDLFGQCASETIGSAYYTGSGGQADFARAVMFSPGGLGFTVLHATADHGRISRIVPVLDQGAVVTTTKNTVDRVVTEYGVAELRGRSLRERATRLIAVAAPSHRDVLEQEAQRHGLLPSRRGVARP